MVMEVVTKLEGATQKRKFWGKLGEGNMVWGQFGDSKKAF